MIILESLKTFVPKRIRVPYKELKRLQDTEISPVAFVKHLQIV